MNLPDEQLERLADLIAERLGGQHTAPAELIDAAAVSNRFTVSRAFVYEHADQLGAVRLGDGERPRLRFDAAKVAAYFERTASAPSTPSEPARPRSRRTSCATAPLLPIRGEHTSSTKPKGRALTRPSKQFLNPDGTRGGAGGA